MRPVLAILMAGALLTSLTVVGCKHSSRGDRIRISQSAEAWNYRARLHDEWDGISYFWQTDLVDAIVEIHARDYAGEIRVRIFDHDEVKIFDTSLHECCFDRHDRHLSVTAPGEPGIWRVRIDYEAFHGKAEVFIEDPLL